MPREAQGGSERPREAQGGRACIEQACPALGWLAGWGGRPKPKSGQQLTDWEAAFLKGPNSPIHAQRPPKGPLVAPGQKVASFIGKTVNEPGASHRDDNIK